MHSTIPAFWLVIGLHSIPLPIFPSELGLLTMSPGAWERILFLRCFVFLILE